MASRKRIKGITIALDGETKGLDKALQDVNKRSRDLQSELREVNNALKFNPDNVELLAQKQRLLTEQIENTTEKLERLRSVQKQVEEQYARGDIGAEQYRAFRREIIKTESQLDGFKKELAAIDDIQSPENLKKDFQEVTKEVEQAKEEIKNVGSELTNMIAGAAAGVGIAEIIEQSLDLSKLDTKIDITFDIPEESKAAVKEAINVVTSYEIDVEEALEGVRRQWALNADASDEANARIVKGAAVIASAYAGLDFTELIQEINEIAGELEVTDEEALGLVNSLLKIGFPPEQIDIIAEYGQQLRRAGYEAEDIQAIMAAGVRTDTWNIDNLLDGLKEGRIRMAEFGEEVPKAMGELLDKAGISKKQFQEWGQAVAKGGEEGLIAMQQVVQAVAKIEDETTKNAIATQIWGTMWEDQGENIIETLMGIDENLMYTEENQELLNQTIEQMSADPAVQLKEALGQIKIALEPLLLWIADFVSKIAEWIEENPKLAATITAIVTVLAILIGLLMGLMPIITGLSAAAMALNIGLLPMAGIVLGIIAAIAALIAIGVALWKNWDTVKAKAKELKDGLVNAFKAVSDKISDIWSGIWSTIKGFINKIIDGINKMIGGLNKLKFDAPDWVPFIGGKSFGINIPKIPRLARGGVVSEPTLAMVGDAGPGNPEIVAPEKMLRKIIRETLGELLSTMPQQKPETNRPIILQIDGKTFAQIIWDYTDQEGGVRIRRNQRGLAT